MWVVCYRDLIFWGGVSFCKYSHSADMLMAAMSRNCLSGDGFAFIAVSTG